MTSTSLDTSTPTLIFMGTPLFAVATLSKLLDSQSWNIAAVITQPDKPSGRGQKLHPSPVKQLAIEHNLKVFQPQSLKDIQQANEELSATSNHSRELVDFLNALPRLDALIAVAYGKIIPASLLNFPRIGTVNIHPSLLPRFRGAAPIQHCIFSGDTMTGVSIMLIDEGLDTGPVYRTQKVPIQELESFGLLQERLAEIGSSMLVETLPQILGGSLRPSAQTEIGATYANKWEKQDTVINWQESARVTEKRIRASSPTPGSRTNYGSVLVKILQARKTNNQNYPASPPGTVVESNDAELVIATGSNQYLSIDNMQFPGKKCLPIKEIMKGHKFQVGDKFA